MAIGNSSFVPKDLTAILTGAENIKLTNLTATLANTEYPHVLQSDLKALRIRARGNSKLQYSFTSEESGTNYWTIPVGCNDEILNINFTGKTLYIQSNKALTVIEIVEFY